MYQRAVREQAMSRSDDRRWELINEALAAEGSGRSPRLFSSRRTLFGIPSALDQELEAIAKDGAAGITHAKTGDDAPKRSTRGSADVRTKEPTQVVHPLKPVFDDRSKVLILGTMPSPTSRETGFYYNHPQNRFWKVMAAIFDAPLPQTNEEKEAFALEHRIALWDVLAQCTIEGASDATIAECIPNDIGSILGKAPIERIFCTGTKAFELYEKYCEGACGMAATKLPSTSSANASKSLEALIDDYGVVAKAATS